ncbi:MAG TPA: hypothetical protein VI670_13935 [Thermoanaerobaculia bacterium]|jgi:hypothetical protein
MWRSLLVVALVLATLPSYASDDLTPRQTVVAHAQVCTPAVGALTLGATAAGIAIAPPAPRVAAPQMQRASFATPRAPLQSLLQIYLI